MQLKMYHDKDCNCSEIAVIWIALIEQGVMSHQTHYRWYQGQVFMGELTQPTVSKH